MSKLWIGVYIFAVTLFGGASVAALVYAFHFWLHPPDWEIYLAQSPDPNLRSLTKGDFVLPFLMSGIPLGFCLIWSARLWDALKRGEQTS